MKFVTNENGQNHRDAIEHVLNDANDATICVAFMKSKAVSGFIEHFNKIVSDGGSVKIIVGLDFYITEPDALTKLLKLQNAASGSVNVYIISCNPDTFHPKIFFGKHGGDIRYLIGSANFTLGGFGQNIEASISGVSKSDTDFSKSMVAFIEGVIRNEKCQILNALNLNQYEAAFNANKKEREKFAKSVKSIEIETKLNVNIIGECIKLFQASDDFKKLDVRLKNYAAAKEIQTEIATSDGIPKKTFANLVGRLIGTRGLGQLWHSGGLNRNAAAVISKKSALADLFRGVYDDIIAEKSVDDVFVAAMRRAGKIRGVGVNWITEIMMTFNPALYGVFNNNTRTSLIRLGFHKLPTPDRIDGAGYKNHIDLMLSLKEKIGADNFLEVDSFLNYIYQQIKKERMVGK